MDNHLALETLNLGFNEIGTNGGCTIAMAMQNKEQLQSLNLNGNQVSIELRNQDCFCFEPNFIILLSLEKKVASKSKKFWKMLNDYKPSRTLMKTMLTARTKKKEKKVFFFIYLL